MSGKRARAIRKQVRKDTVSISPSGRRRMYRIAKKAYTRSGRK